MQIRCMPGNCRMTLAYTRECQVQQQCQNRVKPPSCARHDPKPRAGSVLAPQACLLPAHHTNIAVSVARYTPSAAAHELKHDATYMSQVCNG